MDISALLFIQSRIIHTHWDPHFQRKDRLQLQTQLVIGGRKLLNSTSIGALNLQERVHSTAHGVGSFV